MLPVVFIIGVLNLTLGFALAVLLERQVVVPFPRLREEQPPEPGLIIELPVRQAVSLEEMRERLPKRWLKILEASDDEFHTFVDASFQILKLEVETYRGDLLDVEDRVRSAIEKKEPEAIHDAIQVLVALNEEWVDRQRDALAVLADSRDKLGEYAAIGSQLETILLDQTSLIESRCGELLGLDVQEGEAPCESIIRILGQLVSMAHILRDTIQNATLLIICNENRLESSGRRLHQDPTTGLQNRLGIELIFEDWWREDAERRRLACVSMIDLDRFGELNNQVGTRVGDRVLKTIANYLEQLINSENGLECVFRYGGQQFLIFYGDSGLRSVTTKIETIRQTIEATKFEYHGKQFSQTVRAGVTEVRKDDTTDSLYQRLGELVDAAKHAGRNRIGLEEASGSGAVQPEPLDVKPRTVRVE